MTLHMESRRMAMTEPGSATLIVVLPQREDVTPFVYPSAEAEARMYVLDTLRGAASYLQGMGYSQDDIKLAMGVLLADLDDPEGSW